MDKCESHQNRGCKFSHDDRYKHYPTEWWCSHSKSEAMHHPKCWISFSFFPHTYCTHVKEEQAKTVLNHGQVITEAGYGVDLCSDWYFSWDNCLKRLMSCTVSTHGQKTFNLTFPSSIIKGRKTKSPRNSSRLLGDCVYWCVQNSSRSQ